MDLNRVSIHQLTDRLTLRCPEEYAVALGLKTCLRFQLQRYTTRQVLPRLERLIDVRLEHLWPIQQHQAHSTNLQLTQRTRLLDELLVNYENLLADCTELRCNAFCKRAYLAHADLTD